MCRILLVEDDHRLRPKIVTVLDEAGYSVVPSGTVAEALALVSEHELDLAIIDLKLPNGDGMEIVREIHERTSIIILTGYPSHEARNEASLYGVAAFLEKPYNEEDLVTVVDETLLREGHRMSTHTRARSDLTRKMGDGINLETIYARLAALSSRQRTLAREVSETNKHIREQNGTVSEIKSGMKVMMDRTAQCDERGRVIAVLQDRADKLSAEDIAVLKEKARVSGLNWERVIQIVLTLITGAAAVFVTRAANQLANALGNTPVP